MIAKSDLIILVLSASALAAGVYRWQVNVQGEHGFAASSPPAAVASASSNRPDTPTTRVLGTIAGSESDTASSTIEQPDIIEVKASAIGEPIVVEDTGSIGSTQQESYGTYRVQNGDYLGLIAQRFDTDIATLRELNGISGSIIRVGQQIRYPQQVAN